MRNNQPCINEQYELPQGVVIITHTDLQSRITYANQAFLDSSGYSAEECMGEPQNLVRHPDMPREAFADLWRTIKSGQPWSGLVKNRRKNGGFYWVRAYVSPIVDSGRRVGYLSIRVKPTAEEIAAADALYTDIRSGRGGKIELSGGHVRDRSLAGRLRAAREMPMRTAAQVALGTCTALFLAIGMAALLAVPPLGWLAAGLVAGASALGAALSIGGIVVISQRLLDPLQAMIDTARKVVDGDTRADFALRGDPQIRALAVVLNQIGAKLTGVMTEARHVTDEMLRGAERIVEDNAKLSDRASETAASLEQTAASVEQLTATVNRNTENAQRASDLARQASSITAEGGDVVGQVAHTMTSISESSRRITDIVGLIDGIAFQTNLLALNAAVEAARAGEQGRGFGVVAEEVRNLAQRAGAAAREIRELISASVTTVDQGAVLVANAEKTMQEVVGAVQRVTTIVGEIGHAGREQAAGIEQINRAVIQMDAITQRDAAMAQSVAQTAERLREQSSQVMQVVTAFSLKTTGGAVSLGGERPGSARVLHERPAARRSAA